MKLVGTPLGATLIASLPAGPLFVTTGALELLYATVPAPISIDPVNLFAFVITLFVSLVPGFLLAFIPVFLGAAFMVRAGEISETARDPVSWVVAGTAAGAFIAFLIDAQMFAPPFIGTSGICAWFCRRQLEWEDDQA